MKAERRHELKENDLAHALRVAKDYLDENGKWVGMVVIAAIATVAVVKLASGHKAASREDAWAQRSTLKFATVEEGRQSIEILTAVTKEAQDEGFVFSALMDIGKYSLQLAEKVDDPPDTEFNKKAGDAFQTLLERYPENKLAQGVARTGLATVEENYFVLDQDAVHKERARQHLTAVVENPALNNMPFHRIAVERLEKLDETFTTVRFEPAPEPEEVPALVPEPVTLEPVAPEDLPLNLRKIEFGPDGTIEPVDTP